MSQISYGTITITDTTDIESIVVEYARNQSSSSAPDSGWSTTRPDWAQGYYIWQRTRIHKTGTPTSADTFGTAVCVTGSTGQTGATGRAVSGVTTQFAISNSNSTAPSSGWGDNVPAYDSTKPYYWVKTTTTYSSGNPTIVTYLDSGLASANATAAAAQSTASAAASDASTALDTAQNTKTALDNYKSANDTAVNALKAQATHYWWDSEGAHVASGESPMASDNLTQGTPSTYGFNALMAPGSLALRQKAVNLVQLATNALTFYIPPNSTATQGPKALEVGTNGLKMFNPVANNNVELMSLTTGAITFKDLNGNVQATFGSNGAIQSGNYSRGTAGTKFASNGTKIDLINGEILTKYFRLSQGVESGVSAGAYIYGTIEAIDGKIGDSTNNYWSIGNYTDYNLTTSAAIRGHGTSFIQLGDSSTWRLATNRIHTGWYTNNDDLIHYGKYTDGSTQRFWDYGLHTPTSRTDKFLYIRAANNTAMSGEDDEARLTNLLYDIDDNYGSPQWTYKFYVDGNGNLYASNLYYFDSNGNPIQVGGTDSAYLPKSGGTITGNLTVNGTITGTLSGTASNANKVNNLTVQTAVPANAIFTDENVKSSVADTTKLWLVGTSVAGTRTGALNYDSGIYITTTAGVLHATTFEGALSGTALRATADSDGNTIKTTYLKLTGGQVTGAVSFGDSVSIDDLTAGNLIVNGAASFTNGLYGTLTGNASTSDKVNHDLVITLNSGTTEGTNKFTFNGSTAKSINITKSSIGLGNVENKSSATIRGELTSSNVTTALGYTPVSKAGDTMTGGLKVPYIANTDGDMIVVWSTVTSSEVKAQNSSLTVESSDSDWLTALLKAICVKYPNYQSTIFKGRLEPNSAGYYEVYIYNTSAVQNGLPQYSYGTYFRWTTNYYIFQTASYVFNIYRIYHGNHKPTKTDVGLGNVTNNAQVKGLASGTTNGHLVSWGADGYTVTDSGVTKGNIVKSIASNNDGQLVLTYADNTTSAPITVKIIGSEGSSVSYADALNVNGTAVGSTSIPVYIDVNGRPQTITSYGGNAATATKASQDSDGNTITTSYLRRYPGWYENDSHDIDTLRAGITFAYKAHNALTTGTIAAFACSNNHNYTLQLMGGYAANNLYFRNRNGDNATWGSWRELIYNSGTWNISITGNADTATTAATAATATKATQDSDGNTINTTYFKKAGGTISGNLMVTGTISKSNYKMIDNLVSSAFSGTRTGTVKITLPFTIDKYDMPIFHIFIYEYNSNAASEIIIGGHNWPSGNTYKWYSTGYAVNGTYKKGVRLANDGTHWVILLGTTTSSWDYLSIHLKSVYTEYTNNSSLWATGDYSISLITDESNITEINTPALKTLYPLKDGTGASGKWGISISGNADTATTAATANSVAWENITSKPINLKAYTGSLSSGGWAALNGKSNSPSIAISYNGGAAAWNSSTYSASMVFGCGDTRGLLDLAYSTPIVTFGGAAYGNATDDNPGWYFKLSGTKSQTYTLPSSTKTLAAADGSNASGTWSITTSNVTTTADTSNALYPIGVTNGATTVLKRDTSITITGGNINATSFTMSNKANMTYDASLDAIVFSFA